MEQQAFIATAWTNSTPKPSGSGYGLTINTRNDNDSHFRREWSCIELHLPDVACPIRIEIANGSFWSGRRRRLVKKEIGFWLLSYGMAPWPLRHPPRLWLLPRGGGAFDVRPIGHRTTG